ncbi:transcriptional regulator, LysR family [Ancylobacter novellus DSM 506]|uniref:Transcriptional regulator, LysR family n=1 Tax=Ancylobacter novellus (strain ATCC 8093 / DSM 506 / JCM 20403 / CCM 1077 / IAM 12100 / NBRC 12443 / NCIMB 10456) TaxID=639283 RepID=D7A869_ANCN5|nr:LysR family transcriptional regulator [Ancylobacter novellus]ADH88542.1 transcriptional regulator, LysR family [Ancylobacter novellus DSM 506]
MLDLDLHTFRLVAAVADTGSVTAAAERAGVTQSAVSQALRRAEALIGTPLFDRSRRPLTPTHVGRMVASRADELARAAERLLADARAAAELPGSIDLRIGLVDSLAGTVGARIVRELADGALALTVTAWSGLAFSHTQALMRHEIDVALTCDPMEGLGGVERIVVFREPYVLIAPRTEVDVVRGRDLQAVLEHYRLVRHSARSYAGQHVERHLGRMGLRPPRAFEFDTSDALVAMVATGMGVAITTPLCILQGAAHTAGIVAMPLPGAAFSRELLLTTRRGDFDDLAPRIAEVARSVARSHALPSMLAIAPWLTPEALALG